MSAPVPAPAPNRRAASLPAALLRSFTALPAWETLGCLYVIFTLARILCAFAATQTPVIMPDSALYLNLSRSIFEKGALLFRGQPIRYEYILYPLLLSPLHLLSPGVSLFRAVQVLNALVMHLAVFPAYALARSVTKSHSRGLLIAFLTLLMPDFLITEHVMAESLAFPLIITCCYAFYKTYDSPFRLGVCALWGSLGLLLYALKPGYAALPTSFFLLLLWEAFRLRSLNRLFQALAGALFLLAFLGLYTLFLHYGLHVSLAQSTLYGSQTHPLTWDHLLQTFNGLWVYGAFVPLAFGFYTLYLPAAHLRAFEGRDRRLLQAVLMTVFVLILGTVYMFYYDELSGGNPYAARVHVRYVAAFLPVLLAFCLSLAVSNKRMNTPLFAFLAFSFVCLISFDTNALLSGNNYPVDALLLTADSVRTQGFSGGLLWPIAAGIFVLVMGYRLFKNGYGAWEQRFLCAFLAFAFVVNGALAFALNRHHNDPALPREAREAVQLAGTEGTLAVVTDGAFFWPEAGEVDIASRCTLPVVELDDLIKKTAQDGSIPDFLPAAYWQEQPVNAISAPRKLIVAGDILYSLILAEQVQTSMQVTSGQGYCVLTVPQNGPWIHSGLSGLDQKWVKAGSRFTLFDESLRAKGSITLQLQARAGQGQAQLTLRCGTQEQSFSLADSLSWISATFAVEDPGKALTVGLENSGGNVYVETYLVE